MLAFGKKRTASGRLFVLIEGLAMNCRDGTSVRREGKERDGSSFRRTPAVVWENRLFPFRTIALCLIRAFERGYRTGMEEGFEIGHVVEDARTYLGIARAFVLTAPYFQRVGPDAEILGRLGGVQFLLGFSHIFSFGFLPPKMGIGGIAKENSQRAKK